MQHVYQLAHQASKQAIRMHMENLQEIQQASRRAIAMHMENVQLLHQVSLTQVQKSTQYLPPQMVQQPQTVQLQPAQMVYQTMQSATIQPVMSQHATIYGLLSQNTGTWAPQTVNSHS